jgi:hypothetical protein
MAYGKMIVQAVEELIRARDCPKINLPDPNQQYNIAVITFYAALGYTWTTWSRWESASNMTGE